MLQREREERKWVLADGKGCRRGREAREGAALALMDPERKRMEQEVKQAIREAEAGTTACTVRRISGAGLNSGTGTKTLCSRVAHRARK